MRVLVVDDLPEICHIFRETARKLRGVVLDLVTEVADHRALARVQEEPFDVVISDFRMRRVNGLEVLASARRRHPEGYRILMTGYGEIPTTLRELQEAHVDAYVRKPLQPQELLMLLISFIHRDEGSIAEYRAEARSREASAATRAPPDAAAPAG